MKRVNVIKTEKMTFSGEPLPIMGTLFKCKACPYTFKVKGVFENITDKKQKKNFQGTVSAYICQHDCTYTDNPEAQDGGEEGEEEEVWLKEMSKWSPADNDVEKWTSEQIGHYLATSHPESAPSLAYVRGMDSLTKKFLCVFRHPDSTMLSKEHWIHQNFLFRVPAYRKMLTDVFVKETVYSWFDKVIANMQREEEYSAPPNPKRRALKNGGSGFFCNSKPAKWALGPNKNRLHPARAYEALLRLIRKENPTLLSPTDMDNIVNTYNLDYWCAPFSVEENFPLRDVANVLHANVKEATLFVKPSALRSWIYVAKQLPSIFAHLVVYRGDSKIVKRDLSGFCAFAGDISVSKQGGGEGIVCALLNDSKDICSTSGHLQYNVSGDDIVLRSQWNLLVLGHVVWM